jgi:NAD-dependent DNA ligase
MAWGGYRVYRQMMVKRWAKPIALLAGVVAACLLAVAWVTLTVVVVSPNDWLRLSPVVAITLTIFYATWRYTRLTHSVTTETGEVGQTAEISKTVEVSEVGQTAKISKAAEVSEVGQTAKISKAAEVSEVGQTVEISKAVAVSEVNKTGEVGVTPSEPHNKVVQLAADEDTTIEDHWNDYMPAKAMPSEDSVADLEVGTLLPALYEFDYANEDGEISSRIVFLRTTSVSGERQYLEGICKTRNAKRTFRVDRVIGPMIRVEDGYLIRASELFSMSSPRTFQAFPANKPSGIKKQKIVRERKTAVVFAGFSSVKRSELEELAEAAGWQVRSTITKTVTYVVIGSMAGTVQLATANELEIPILDEDMFRGRV